MAEEAKYGSAADSFDSPSKSMKSQQRLHQPTGIRGKGGKAKKAIDIEKVSPKKDLNSIDNCLEFLLVTLSKCFQLQPKQAAGLLTEGSKYLSHIIIKGLKSDFKPVIAWLMEVYASSKHFSNLIKAEEQAGIKMVLNSFKGGLYSKSKDVMIWTAKVYNKIIYDFRNLDLSKEVWEWFIGIEGGLEGFVYALNKEEEIVNDTLSIFINVAKENL